MAKAQLIELDDTLKDKKPGGKTVTVQFNPESLKLSFANQIQNNAPSSSAGGGGTGAGAAPAGKSADQAHGTEGRQFVGAGTTKLALQLWFDANSVVDGAERVDDVRRLTQQVIYFMKATPAKEDKTKFLPPGVRFLWGSFLFDGLVDGIEETIDFFSPDGKPLRATISMTLSQQTIYIAELGSAGPLAGRRKAPGTTPMTPAAAGSTLQGLAALGGAAGVDWQAIAAANGIDNPRHLVPGQLIDLSVTPPRFSF